jgi:archaeosine synthase
MDAAAAAATLGDGRGKAWGEAELLAHSLEAARRELAFVRHAIATGTLRALVERRAASKPASVELLRRFDREHGYLEAAAPRQREATLPAMTIDALWMPEVESFRRRVRGSYAPPSAPILVLLPCSQKKPYKTSRSHRAFARVLDDSGIRPLLHEVMITSPLGLVPRELEEVYPAQAYDIPVTGHWLRDEEAIVREQLAALLAKGQYRHVVVHAGQATFDVLRDLLPEETRHTCLHHPTRQDDLDRLAAELARLKPLVKADVAANGNGATAHPADRKLADLRALLSFQFSEEVAAELTDGAIAHGRMPFVKLERAGVQVGMTTIDRGVVSLTLEGAKALAARKTKRVMIGDFTPKKTSTLFAVGVVGADPDVRVGDEVAIVRASAPGVVLGCGVAQMDGATMTHLKRGVACTLRHLVSEKTKPSTEHTEGTEPSVVSVGSVDRRGGGA